MPDGNAYSGGGIHMRPRDFLKFGRLYLDGGRWDGRALVPPGWVTSSTAHQATTPDGGSDGFGWHRHTLRIGDKPVEVIEANGNGGQFLFVVPSLDLTVVFTAGNYNQYRVWRALREEWLPHYILQAVVRH
jgi:CubicO group peptidase (beta-lactamase class C family)